MKGKQRTRYVPKKLKQCLLCFNPSQRQLNDDETNSSVTPTKEVESYNEEFKEEEDGHIFSREIEIVNNLFSPQYPPIYDEAENERSVEILATPTNNDLMLSSSLIRKEENAKNLFSEEIHEDDNSCNPDLGPTFDEIRSNSREEVSTAPTKNVFFLGYLGISMYLLFIFASYFYLVYFTTST
ncbi:hypothetical protein RND81_02G030200 [Saponaria officinalis]|uniref:Uncharacterized protein n=1 Tax=Saponaria officinalis TaxID=3572 RepID=A0AAW1MPE8_SAPOF